MKRGEGRGDARDVGDLEAGLMQADMNDQDEGNMNDAVDGWAAGGRWRGTDEAVRMPASFLFFLSFVSRQDVMAPVGLRSSPSLSLSPMPPLQAPDARVDVRGGRGRGRGRRGRARLCS